MKTGFITKILLVLGIVGMIVLGIYMPPGAADKPFTNSSLDGTYGFTAKKTGTSGIFLIGTINYDGNGNCFVNDKIFYYTKAYTESFECTYSVNPDGTGTQSMIFEESVADYGQIFFITFVIVDNNKEVQFAQFASSREHTLFALYDLYALEGVAKKQ